MQCCRTSELLVIKRKKFVLMEYLLYFILILFVKGGIGISCDGDWVQGWGAEPSHCYLFVNNSLLNWNQASSACKTQGASLVYFDSAQELSWFKSKIPDHWSYAYWTDLNIPPYDLGLMLQNGMWTWGKYRAVNPSLLKTFWNASPAKPDRPLCMGINTQGKFEDLNCDLKQGYACSIPSADEGCPPAWFVTDRGCYWFSDPGQHLLTWSQAKEKCYNLSVSLAPSLLTLSTVEDSTIINITFSLPGWPGEPTTHVYWTSLVTKGNDLVWDSGAQFNPQLIQWAVEPDHVAGQEKCGAVRFNGKFSDRNCSMPLNYACKK